MDYATNPEGQLLTPEQWGSEHLNGRLNSGEDDFAFMDRPQKKMQTAPTYGNGGRYGVFVGETPPNPKFGSYFNKDSFLLRQS